MQQLLLYLLLLTSYWSATQVNATVEDGNCPLVHTKAYLTEAGKSQSETQPKNQGGSQSSTTTTSPDTPGLYHLSLLNFQHHQYPFEKVFLHLKINEESPKTIIFTSTFPPTETYGGMYSDPLQFTSGDEIHFYTTYEIQGKQCDTEMLMATIPGGSGKETTNIKEENDNTEQTTTSQNAGQPSTRSKQQAAASANTKTKGQKVPRPSKKIKNSQSKNASPNAKPIPMAEVAKEEAKISPEQVNTVQYQHPQADPYQYYQHHANQQQQQDPHAYGYEQYHPSAHPGQQYHYVPQQHDQHDPHAYNQQYAYYLQQLQLQQQQQQQQQYQYHYQHPSYAYPQQQESAYSQPESTHPKTKSICTSLELNYTHQVLTDAPRNTYILTFSSPSPLPIDTIDMHSRLNSNEIHHERIAADVSASHIQRVQHVVTVNHGDILSYYWSFHSTDHEGILTECQTEVLTIDNRSVATK